MLKRFLSACILATISLTTANAASFYFGPALNYNNYKSDDLNYQSFMPSIYAGYGGWIREWLNVSGEVFYGAGNIHFGSKDSDGEKDLKARDYYGISVLPLVVLDETLFAFLRLGYIKTNFSSLDTDESAYLIGIGGEYAFSPCWSLRGEFDYAPYDNVADLGTVKQEAIIFTLLYRLEPLMG